MGIQALGAAQSKRQGNRSTRTCAARPLPVQRVSGNDHRPRSGRSPWLPSQSPLAAKPKLHQAWGRSRRRMEFITSPRFQTLAFRGAAKTGVHLPKVPSQPALSLQRTCAADFLLVVQYGTLPNYCTLMVRGLASVAADQLDRVPRSARSTNPPQIFPATPRSMLGKVRRGVCPQRRIYSRDTAQKIDPRGLGARSRQTSVPIRCWARR